MSNNEVKSNRVLAENILQLVMRDSYRQELFKTICKIKLLNIDEIYHHGDQDFKKGMQGNIRAYLRVLQGNDPSVKSLICIWNRMQPTYFIYYDDPTREWDNISCEEMVRGIISELKDKGFIMNKCIGQRAYNAIAQAITTESLSHACNGNAPVLKAALVTLHKQARESLEGFVGSKREQRFLQVFNITRESAKEHLL